MNYYELVFTLADTEDFHKDLLIHQLGEAGFDTFEETESGFNAYIAESVYNETSIEELLLPYRETLNFSYTKNFIKQKNWNEVWESNFEPIQIRDQVYIRATFHPERKEFPYEIMIEPKMSFGTGHHQTTKLMLEWLLDMQLKDKKVLDMGCGTAILGILAAKMGAVNVDAIDYDEICYASAKENAVLNNVNLNVFCGSKEVIPNKKYDILLANINRNILLDQIERYSEAVSSHGVLLLSGFYEEDLEILKQEAEKYHFIYSSHQKMDNWVSAKFIFNK